MIEGLTFEAAPEAPEAAARPLVSLIVLVLNEQESFPLAFVRWLIILRPPSICRVCRPGNRGAD